MTTRLDLNDPVLRLRCAAHLAAHLAEQYELIMPGRGPTPEECLAGAQDAVNEVMDFLLTQEQK